MRIIGSLCGDYRSVIFKNMMLRGLFERFDTWPWGKKTVSFMGTNLHQNDVLMMPLVLPRVKFNEQQMHVISDVIFVQFRFQT